MAPSSTQQGGSHVSDRDQSAAMSGRVVQSFQETWWLLCTHSMDATVSSRPSFTVTVTNTWFRVYLNLHTCCTCHDPHCHVSALLLSAPLQIVRQPCMCVKPWLTHLLNMSSGVMTTLVCRCCCCTAAAVFAPLQMVRRPCMWQQLRAAWQR